MNSMIRKLLSAALCCTVLLGSVGATVYAANNGTDQETPEQKTSSEVKEKTGIIKDETVYVLAGADGSVDKIIVSDWLKNTDGSDAVSDVSELTDVETVNRDVTYTMGDGNVRVWDAQGSDVYYQGSINKELPVSVKVSYKLNGKAVSAEELAGKSGEVVIRFDYINNEYETVEIDGVQEKVYVPFTVLTGVMLDNDIFTNVEVSNGKLINDGDRIAAAGIAFPGLQSNLNVSSDRLSIPDYVEIKADVKNFELTNTVTIATNEIFSELDGEKLSSADSLGSMDELTDAMTQLMDGSSRLYDGLCTLLDKSGELISGIDKLADGASRLNDGAGAVGSGVSELSSGAQQLAGGLGELAANSDSLNAGASQVFYSLLNMASTQLEAAGLPAPGLTIENYADVLNGIISSLDPDNLAGTIRAQALQKVTEEVNAQRDVIAGKVTEAVREQVASAVTEAVRENVEENVLLSQGMTKEQYEEGINAGVITEQQQAEISAAIEMQMQSAEVQGIIEANISSQMESEEMQGTIAVKTEEQIEILIEQNMNSGEVQEQITKALEQAQSGAAKVSALKEQLDGYNAFYSGLSQYTYGVAAAKSGADQLSAGASRLKAGTSELCSGMSEMYGGILSLKDAAPALIDGVTELKDGSMKLSDGLKELNEKGIQKLVDAVDGDVAGLASRLRATVDVSKNYKAFSGISKDMDGQVKFVYRTEEIK